MNKTIKELEVGKEYIFIEANPQKSKDLNVVRATLKENKEHEKGWYPVFIEKETQGEIFIIFNHEEASKKLDTLLVIHVNSNYDKPEVNEPLEKLFGTWAKPIGYNICDAESIEETINEYATFLNNSLEAYNKKIQDMQEDFKNKTKIYKKQIEWLETAKF